MTKKPDMSELERRKGLTFKQAEGLEPLPAQLRPKELSQELRTLLWQYIHDEIQRHSHRPAGVRIPSRRVSDPWYTILRDIHVRLNRRPADEFDPDTDAVVDEHKTVFFNGDYADVFGWIQHVSHFHRPYEFAQNVNRILDEGRAAYRLVEGVVFPIGLPEEAQTIATAFSDLNAAGLSGAREHLRNAATEVTAGHFADSVRESIHAVESVAKTLEPTGELSKALAKLQESAKIHGGLKAAFSSLYGYSSDSEGIRHALVFKDAPEVDETDALFMIGACAAFVSYLVNKGRKVGIIR